MTQNVNVYILWKHNVYKKLVTTEFCREYNLVKEKTFYKIPQNQIWIDILPITDGQKFPEPDYSEAGLSLSQKLVVTRKV